MDDLEYSVEIFDRDWEGFFAECEECNLLPPSLASVDDSGMSDIDDTGFCLAQRAQRIDPTQGSSENEHHIDDTIECAGSPVEHCLIKHGIGGLDSVLSGSEEDLHLQSVNIFFERLKSVTEAESSQVRVGNKAIQEEEPCGNGQQASRNNLPKNFPKSNTLPASSETALGTETMRPVGASGNLKTKEKIKAESNISSEPAAFSNSKVKSCKPSEIEPFIREEASRETRVNEVAQWNQSYDSTNSVVCSETTPQSFSVEMCRSLDEQEGLLTSQVRLSKKSGMRDIPNQESSPSSSLRRKKKKKRRLSVEAGQACERQVLVKQTDSEEEQHASREGAGLCLSEESVHLNEPQEKLTYFPSSYSSNLPVDIFANQIENVHLPNAELRQRRFTATGLDENNLNNHKTLAPLSQSDDNVMFSASNSANDAKHLQLCSKLQVENSAGLFGNENQNHVIKAGDLQKFDKMNTSVNGCENEQYQNYSPAEDKSVSRLPSAESCAPPVEVSQNVKQSAAKSVLAAEAGNSGKDKSTLCQSELQQQLESDCHDTNQCSRTLGNTHFSAPTIAVITSHTLDVKSSQLEISDEVNLTSDCINQPYDKSYVPTYLSSLDPEQQTDHPIEVKTSDISSEKNIETEKNPSEASQKLVLTSHSQTESKLSLSKGLKKSPSDITLVSSCCTLDTDSVTSFSNENLTDMSLSFCSSASEHESGSQGEKKVPIFVKHEEEDFTPGPKSKPECKCDILGEAEDAITASKAVDEPEKMENSVFAMSSFWREMEKVTINDILGLRYIRKASPNTSLPPVQESEETDLFAVCDQGNFTQNDESKQTEQTTEEISVIEPYSSRSEVTWDSEPVPVSHGGIIYTVNTLLASVTDTSEPVLSDRAQKCLKKISKAISVHNLQALESESFSYAQKGEPLQTLDESESAPKIDKDVKSFPSSVTDSYSISLTDIFQYLFGDKQSVPHHSATDDTSTLYTGGNSVPETYDHFFSEFDTENFFYPLITAEEKKQDKTVPIFSCSHSAGRNLQFPEAYEYFFASSSSDDSSVESDEEENCPLVRVVSRFTPKASSAEINTDLYEDFFTDSDFRDEFFCLKSLSFRKVKFSASTAQKQMSNSVSLVHVRQSCRSSLRADPHLNALGNPDVMFPDPLLYHLEERISRQLAQQPFIYEDLQATISNPGLDAPLMPLKQSDMCLVCIAFASWVLKTANPQVGDAWKAVLLANISALSAIRYLRKYVKVKAAANETTLHHPALTYP